MPQSKSPGRLLEEWARTVKDLVRACVELERLSNSGCTPEALRCAEKEAYELKLVADRARRRYRARIRIENERRRYGALIKIPMLPRNKADARK